MTDTPTNSTPIAPASPPSTGTIDITNLVEALKNAWIKWGTTYLTTLAASTPYTFWLKWPVISTIFNFFVELGMTALAKALEMQGFFVNTAIRKASQAGDFISAVNAKDSLPPTATQEEYENAEKAQMAAFRNFVMVTN